MNNGIDSLSTLHSPRRQLFCFSTMCASVQKLNLYEDDKVVHILSISLQRNGPRRVFLMFNNLSGSALTCALHCVLCPWAAGTNTAKPLCHYCGQSIKASTYCCKLQLYSRRQIRKHFIHFNSIAVNNDCRVFCNINH